MFTPHVKLLLTCGSAAAVGTLLMLLTVSAPAWGDLVLHLIHWYQDSLDVGWPVGQ